ncbi:MAG: NERD domain-containing protein [Kiritimatiellae bacterium]|nr:NERD domain-containing protein [Kiritimatiellia bacterium]
MAVIHGVAGEWARVKGTVAGLWPLFLGVFAAGFSLALFLAFPLTAASLLVASLLWIIWSLVQGLRKVERFFKGARGEERVSEILNTLPDGYHVFNDFVARGKHVDHVVVGPGGVFSIETKFWRGKVTVEDGHVLLDGQLPDRSPIAQANREAMMVRGALADAGWQGVVTPVLTFASNTFATHRAEIKGTIVMNASELKESFSSDRVVIPPQELERLVSLMANM